jgi:hypothetical protein
MRSIRYGRKCFKRSTKQFDILRCCANRLLPHLAIQTQLVAPFASRIEQMQLLIPQFEQLVIVQNA